MTGGTATGNDGGAVPRRRGPAVALLITFLLFLITPMVFDIVAPMPKPEPVDAGDRYNFSLILIGPIVLYPLAMYVFYRTERGAYLLTFMLTMFGLISASSFPVYLHDLDPSRLPVPLIGAFILFHNLSCLIRGEPWKRYLETLPLYGDLVRLVPVVDGDIDGIEEVD